MGAGLTQQERKMLHRVPFTPGDLTDHQWGTDDILTGDPNTNILIRDAGGSMFDFSRDGNDTFAAHGSLPSRYTFYGDAVGGIFDFAQGGDDTFTGASGSINTAYGDAGGDMSDHSKGGNDIFTGAPLPSLSTNTFYGDAGGNMSDHAQGGNDTFTGGSVFSTNTRQ